MHRFVSFSPQMVLLVALLIVAPATAQDRSTIIDDAAMFSKEAIRQAQDDLAAIDRDYKIAVTVETVDSLGGQGINEFTQRRAEILGHKGIFILIAKKDRKAQVIASRDDRDRIGPPRLIQIRDAFTDEFRAGKVDEGLIRGVKAAGAALAEVMPKVASPSPEGSTSPNVGVGRGPLFVRDQSRLTLEGARTAIEAARVKATSLGLKSNIAVVDDGGHLLAFARMDGARPASVATAITKAASAATFRQASGPSPAGGPPDLLLNLSLQDAAQAGGGKFTSLRGGLPIVVDGQVIGAIGVGGGTGEQDVEVAQAGLDAFAEGTRTDTAGGDFGTPKPR